MCRVQGLEVPLVSSNEIHLLWIRKAVLYPVEILIADQEALIPIIEFD